MAIINVHLDSSCQLKITSPGNPGRYTVRQLLTVTVHAVQSRPSFKVLSTIKALAIWCSLLACLFLQLWLMPPGICNTQHAFRIGRTAHSSGQSLPEQVKGAAVPSESLESNKKSRVTPPAIESNTTMPSTLMEPDASKMSNHGVSLTAHVPDERGQREGPSPSFRVTNAEGTARVEQHSRLIDTSNGTLHQNTWHQN